MTKARAESLGLPYATLLSTIERHNAYPEDPIQMRAGWAMDRDDLYAAADCTPEDISFLCTYDDYPIINAMRSAVLISSMKLLSTNVALASM